MITNRLGFIIENKKGDKILNSPAHRWIEKEKLFNEGKYIDIITCIIPTMIGIEEAITWYEKMEIAQEEKEFKLEDITIKYIKVTFEDIGEVS